MFSSGVSTAKLFGPNAIDPEIEAFNARLIAREASEPHIADIGAVGCHLQGRGS